MKERQDRVFMQRGDEGKEGQGVYVKECWGKSKTGCLCKGVLEEKQDRVFM